MTKVDQVLYSEDIYQSPAKHTHYENIKDIYQNHTKLTSAHLVSWSID